MATQTYLKPMDIREGTTLRKAQAADLEALNELMCRSKGYWEYELDFVDAFMARYAVTLEYLEQAVVYVAEREGAIVGFYGFGLNPEEPTLEYFFILPDYIGKGLGRFLWEHCLKQAKLHDWESFTLISDPDAQPFYEHMGAEKIGDWDSDLIEDRKVPIMRYVFQ